MGVRGVIANVRAKLVVIKILLSASIQCLPLGIAIPAIIADARGARVEVFAERGPLDIDTGSVLGHVFEESHETGTTRLADALAESFELVPAGIPGVAKVRAPLVGIFLGILLSASIHCFPLGIAIPAIIADATGANAEVFAERGPLDIGTGSVLGHVFEEAHETGTTRLADALAHSFELLPAGIPEVAKARATFGDILGILLNASRKCTPHGIAIPAFIADAQGARVEVFAVRGLLDIGTGSVLGHVFAKAHETGTTRLADALAESFELVPAGILIFVVCGHEGAELAAGEDIQRLCAWARADSVGVVCGHEGGDLGAGEDIHVPCAVGGCGGCQEEGESGGKGVHVE